MENIDALYLGVRGICCGVCIAFKGVLNGVPTSRAGVTSPLAGVVSTLAGVANPRPGVVTVGGFLILAGVCKFFPGV